MFGLINVDSFLPVSWSKAFGNRAFQFDAFVSHNRGDKHSSRLVQELAVRGSVAWHDQDQDLRNRKVQEAVSLALTRSRFVVVSVDDCFNDSPWCRAEYLPALNVESRVKVSKLLVAQMTPNAPLPNLLTQHPVFECYRSDELDRLSGELQSGNRVPLEAERYDRYVSEVLPTNMSLDELLSFCGSVEGRYGKGDRDVNALALGLTAHAVSDGNDQRHPQQLMAARQALVESADLSRFSESELKFLVSSALYICSLADSDNRANGIMMLLHLAESLDYLRDEALRVIVRERENSIINLGFPWFERQWCSLDAEQRSVVELCALRDPVHLRLYYRDSPMVAAFSSVVRAKVFARGLDASLLSPQERMHLISERMDYVLGSPEIVKVDSGLDSLRGLMGVSDLEIVFRDLDNFLSDHNGLVSHEVEPIALSVVELLSRVVDHSVRSEGMHLRAMEEHVLDYVLKPLLWCTKFTAARDSAVKVFNGVCDVIETYGALDYEVPIYREYLAIALSGADMSDGLHSKCFHSLQLRMWKVQEDHRRNGHSEL